MYSQNEKQPKNVETVKPRHLEIRLSDTDVLRIAEKAGAHGLTVSQLIESFIGDLVYGMYYNGSDESMYAQQWFERCWFSTSQEVTFLSFLINCGMVEDVLELWEDLEDAKNDLAYYEEHPDKPEPEETEEIQEFIQTTQEKINQYWNQYTQRGKGYQESTFNEEMEKVLEWKASYKQLAGE